MLLEHKTLEGHLCLINQSVGVNNKTNIKGLGMGMSDNHFLLAYKILFSLGLGWSNYSRICQYTSQ